MSLTQTDLERLLATTRHNKNYDVKRAAIVLYQSYVRHTSLYNIAARLHIGHSRTSMIRSSAILKLRAVWPLFSQADVSKLYANTAMRDAIWPDRTPTTVPKTH